MKVLLVEPDYGKASHPTEGAEDLCLETSTSRPKSRNDEVLRYPPLGLLKLSTFHKMRGDDVHFIRGCNVRLMDQSDLFSSFIVWDRIYITTLFTFDWHKIVKTIQFYKRVVGGTVSRIFVGGIMATLMADEINEETGVYPVPGVLVSPSQIGLDGNVNIDLLPPDYDLLDPSKYAINDTYYAYTSRGCVNKCTYCGVHRLEPEYINYIDIKPVVLSLRARHGDKPRLKLMDNNILASPRLDSIVRDLQALGYGRNCYTEGSPRRQRVVDFNQGLDSSFFTEDRVKLLCSLNIKPMRIAFDRASERRQYVQAVELARKYGMTEFSNYMLYNWQDTPRDLYERLTTNIELNESRPKGSSVQTQMQIYSYPMRFAPIDDLGGTHVNRSRDFFPAADPTPRNWLKDPAWTRKFVRNVEVMKGAAHGAISPTPGLGRRTIGATFEEFLANLYMPEELLRNRNKHEQMVYAFEPSRKAGTGKIEEFRKFILHLLSHQDERFHEFHSTVTQNSLKVVRQALKTCHDEELRRWLRLYLKRL